MKTKASLLSVVFIILPCFIFTLITPGCARAPEIEWVSPYKDLDWDNIIRAKGQFHVHTTHSDGRMSPQLVVDHYNELGYDILAITDHWLTTWPWQEFSTFEASDKTHQRYEEGFFEEIPYDNLFLYKDRDPDAIGMVAIKGSEPSHTGPQSHHMVSLFSDVTGRGMDFEETLTAAAEAGGLFSFAHPARQRERDNNELEDYIYYLDKYPHIYGIDIFTRATFNQPERWPINKELLTRLINHYGSPADDGWRPVWMTCTDDLHRISDIDRALQIQLVETLDQENVYQSLKDGAFFWVAKAFDEEVPYIESIDFKHSSLIVNGKGFDEVQWYFDNRVIHTGETFDIVNHGSDEVFYVYFMAQTSDFSIEEGTGAMIGSQPFWILRNID